MQLSAKGADAEVTKDSIVEALGYEPEKVQGDYVLIEEFTLTEDMERIDRSQEPNGTAYKFDAAVVTTEYSSWTAVARYVVFNSKNDGKGYNLTTGVSQTMAALQARAYKHGNLWYCFCCHGSTSDVSNIRGQASTQTFSTTSNIDAIRYISIRGTFYADTKIKIYAVRA